MQWFSTHPGARGCGAGPVAVEHAALSSAHQVRSLLTILNDILDFSKIEAGKLVIEKVPFDVRKCVEDVGQLLAMQAAAKRVRFTLNIDQIHAKSPPATQPMSEKSAEGDFFPINMCGHG